MAVNPARPAAPVVPGICSVTFRELDVASVVGLVADAGLRAVEWGGDVHVPVGDEAAAEHARTLCTEKGVEVAALGSYWRAGEGEDFGPVLRTARALGAPGIRVWAGREGSAAVSPAERAGIAARLAAAADEAAAEGVVVSTEYHQNTLTDTPASALALLDEVAALRPGAELPLCSYWQPAWQIRPDGVPPGQAVDELRGLGERLTTVHVFSWDTEGTRMPLPYREELWRTVFAALPSADPSGRGHYALMEFVRDADPAVFRKDAAVFLDWLASVNAD